MTSETPTLMLASGDVNGVVTVRGESGGEVKRRKKNALVFRMCFVLDD